MVWMPLGGGKRTLAMAGAVLALAMPAVGMLLGCGGGGGDHKGTTKNEDTAASEEQAVKATITGYFARDKSLEVPVNDGLVVELPGSIPAGHSFDVKLISTGPVSVRGNQASAQVVLRLNDPTRAITLGSSCTGNMLLLKRGTDWEPQFLRLPSC